MSPPSVPASRATAGPAVRTWEGILPRDVCRRVVEEMAGATPQPGGVLRGGDDEIDRRLRNCSEHPCATGSATVGAAMRTLALDAMRTLPSDPLGGGGPGEVRLDGPTFCSYAPGEYFRTHQDRSTDPRAPRPVRARLLSLVCLLNDADPADGLPTYDGGALVIYVPRPDGTIEPVNMRLTAGSVVVFRSDIAHEVRPVRSGLRYSAVGWLYGDDTGDPTGPTGPADRRDA